MLVPYNQLSSDALYALAKEWVIANISDTDSEFNIIEWTEDVIRKIKKGDLLIEFGEESQTVNLKTKEQIIFQGEAIED